MKFNRAEFGAMNGLKNPSEGGSTFLPYLLLLMFVLLNSTVKCEGLVHRLGLYFIPLFIGLTARAMRRRYSSRFWFSERILVKCRSAFGRRFLLFSIFYASANAPSYRQVASAPIG